MTSSKGTARALAWVWLPVLLVLLPVAVWAQALPTDGVVITEDSRLNLRGGPGTEFAIIGKLDPQTAVRVLARSDDGTWLQVEAPTLGSGWVVAEFVRVGATGATNVAARTQQRPRLGLLGLLATGATPTTVAERAPAATLDPTTVVTTDMFALLPTPTPTPVREQAAAAPVATTAAPVVPLPTATPLPAPDVPTAITQPARMNVRGGPGTGFAIVDGVNAGTALVITGVNPGRDWYRVQLSGDRSGWVSAPLTIVVGPADAIVPVPAEELPELPTPAPQAAQTAPVAAQAVAAPPPAGGGFFGYGIQAHMLGGEAGRALEAVNDLGFNWVKQQVQWKLFEPQQGARNFGDLAGIVGEARNRGINVLFSVVDAPAWAREPGFDGSVGGPPVDPNTYAAFVGALAATFCGDALKAIEIWNEQNLHYEWGNRPLDPAEYMALLRPSYVAIKAACPEMLIISGALTPAGSNPPFAVDDLAYLEGMYRNGLARYADGIGAHPSGYNVPPSVTWQEACAAIQVHGNSFNGACDSPHHSWSFRSTMESYRNVMVVYGDANKRIWPTEFGWAAGGAFDPRYAYANDNSLEEQAAWTVEAYQMMRAWGWVGPAFLWNLNFRVVADGTEKAQWGIVRNDWSPMPAYTALKSMPK